MEMAKNLPVAAQDQSSDSRAVVVAPQDRICTDILKEESGAGEVGFAVEVESPSSQKTSYALAEEALKFGDDVMRRFAISGLKVSIVSPGLASNQSSSPALPRNAAAFGNEVVPLADTVSEVCINESNDEVVVSFARKSSLDDASKDAAAEDGEGLGDFEGYGRILSRKRKASGKMTCEIVGEPVKLTDLGISIKKKDPACESETASEIIAETLHLEALEKAETYFIADEEVPELSIAEGNSSGKYGAAAVDQATLSDTRGKEECSSMPVHVASSARKLRSSPHTSKPPMTRRRTRGARISDETDEDRGTKDAAMNNDSGENLGVSEGWKKSRLEEKSDSPEDLNMSKSKGGPPGEKISEDAARFNDPSSCKEGSSGQASTPVSSPLTFLEAVKILSKKIDQGRGVESILTVARKAGYTFSSTGT